MGVELTDLRYAIPRIFYAGAVTDGQDFNGIPTPGQGKCWIVQGMDFYPAIQPNNGFVEVFASSVNWPVQSPLIYNAQQSANFPGPYFWRGQLPFFFGRNVFQVHADIPWSFTVWGVTTYDFTQDGGLP